MGIRLARMPAVLQAARTRRAYGMTSSSSSNHNESGPGRRSGPRQAEVMTATAADQLAKALAAACRVARAHGCREDLDLLHQSNNLLPVAVPRWPPLATPSRRRGLRCRCGRTAKISCTARRLDRAGRFPWCVAAVDALR